MKAFSPNEIARDPPLNSRRFFNISEQAQVPKINYMRSNHTDKTRSQDIVY